MAERKPNIVKYLKFIVDVTNQNDYGDLIVDSKGGMQYKISNKRAHLFGIFKPGAEVVVGYASYMNKDYIAVAHLASQFPAGNTVEEEFPPKTTVAESDKHVSPIFGGVSTNENKEAIQAKVQPQERGMWWKELGEMLRAGEIDKTKPFGKALRTAYYAEMFRVLGLDIRKEES